MKSILATLVLAGSAAGACAQEATVFADPASSQRARVEAAQQLLGITLGGVGSAGVFGVAQWSVDTRAEARAAAAMRLLGRTITSAGNAAAFAEPDHVAPTSAAQILARSGAGRV